MRIVIADDHEIFRAGLRQVLSANPSLSVVAEVADGESALQAILRQQPEAALLDFDLPRRNGLEVARELVRLRDGTPVVILTAHRSEDLLDEAIASGVRGYLLKDNAATDVMQCLLAVVAGQIYLSPTFSGYLLQRAQRAVALRREMPGLDLLTPAERRVLRLIALGKATKEIAAELFLSPATVETHRKNICARLDLRGTNTLLKFAMQHRSQLT